MQENQSIPSESVSRRPGWLVLLGMLLLLFATEAALRGWIMSQTEIPAQDGTLYVKIAKVLREDPQKAKNKYLIHLGYPAVIVGAHSIMADAERGDSQEQWIRAGKTAALIGSLLTLWAVWVFGSMVFRNVWIGFFGALLFGLGRKFAAIGADVLSDSTMLCFAMWGLVAALQASVMLREQRKITLLWALVAGVLAGAAYWVRPEGFVVILIAVTTWLAIQIRRRISWPLVMGAVIIAVVGVLLVAAPYGVTRKWELNQFTFHSPNPGAPLLAWLGAANLTTKPAVVKCIGQFFEAQQPILASLTSLYLVLWCLSKTRFGGTLRGILPTMTQTGSGMILLSFLWILPPILLRYVATGAMSHRYLFLSASMLAGAPVAGIVVLARLAAAGVSSPWHARNIRWGIPAAAILGIAVGLIIHSNRPLHTNQIFARNAGEWISKRIQPGEDVFSDQFYVGYYCGTRRRRIIEASAIPFVLAKRYPDLTRREFLYKQLDRPRPFCYVALTKTKKGSTILSEVSELLAQRGYRVVKEIPYIQNGKPRPEKKSILIFKIFKRPDATTLPVRPVK